MGTLRLTCRTPMSMRLMQAKTQSLRAFCVKFVRASVGKDEKGACWHEAKKWGVTKCELHKAWISYGETRKLLLSDDDFIFR
jgi:hypothetical protein